jgi:Flp pilus assembly protein TadG
MTMDRGQKGQNLVEFALILPVLLLLLMGIIDFGYVFIAYTGLFNAAREGARYGIVRPIPSADIETRARQMMFLVDSSAATVTVAYDNPSEGTPVFTDTNDSSLCPGARVLVTVTHDLPTLTPLIQAIVPTLRIDTGAKRTIASGHPYYFCE